MPLMPLILLFYLWYEINSWIFHGSFYFYLLNKTLILFKFAWCRLVQERSWLIVCSLGRLFMRLCKCVGQQQGKASSSGPSNWTYTCRTSPGFIWSKRLFYTPAQSILLFVIFNSLTSQTGSAVQLRIIMRNRLLLLTNSAAWRKTTHTLTTLLC